MNVRGGMSLIRKALFSLTAQRGFFWTTSFIWLLPSIVSLFIWLAVSANGTVRGYQRNDFIVYYLAFLLIYQFVNTSTHWTVGELIRSGGFSIWLLRPLPPFYEPIAHDIAVKIVSMPFAFLVTVILALFLHPVIPLNAIHFILFIPVVFLALMIRFLLGYALSLLSLWDNGTWIVSNLNEVVLFFFSGQVAPLAFLPGVLQQLALFLPYRYVLGFPVEVLIGKTDDAAIWLGLGIQIIWVGVLVAACLWLWKQGVRRYVALGG